MATTTHDEGFHEIQLNAKQLVFLFMAGTVVVVVIFLLGVFVGRGVGAQVGPTDPLAADAQSEIETPTPAIPPVAASTGSGAPATAGERLDYPIHLEGKPSEDDLAAAVPERPAPARPAPAPQTPSPAPSARTVPEQQSAPAGGNAVPAEPAGDGFAIQLAALGKREEAEGIVRRLSDKGYSAYLIAPAAGAPQVYRVRVGKFKDRRQAESVSARLQQEEQFKPWIVR